MEEANRVTAYLKVTAEFYVPEATPETVRAAISGFHNERGTGKGIKGLRPMGE